MKAYCINLLSRPDRWDLMEQQAQHAGITLTRVDALDAKEPTVQEILGRMPKNGPIGVLGVGTLACTASHTRAWQTFLDTGEDYGLFLEDDAILSADLAAFLRAFETAGLAIDVLRIEGKADPTKRRVFGKALAQVAGRNIRRCYQLAPDAAGYILSRQGAQIAVERIRQSALPVDHFLYFPGKRKGTLGLKVFQVDPSLVYQDKAFGSDIGQDRYFRRNFRERFPRRMYEVSRLGSMFFSLATGARFRTYAFCDRIDAPTPEPRD